MTIRSGFTPRIAVNDPTKLFGHNKQRGLLDSLWMQFRMGTNCQVLGERGAGKSSVLECVRVRLRASEKLLLPVLVPYDSELNSIAAAYRYFLAAIQAELCRLRGNVDCVIRGTKLTCVQKQEDNFEQLGLIDDARMLEAFRAFFELLSQMRLGVILMIDEYEYFLNRAFQGDVMGFWGLRQIATKTSANDSPKLLTVVLAGARDWRSRTPTGSPVQGMFPRTDYVGPLDASEFASMWTACLEDSDTEIRQVVLQAAPDVQEIRDLTGGWPFHGKVIGQHLVTAPFVDEGELLDQLRPHFDIIWNERSDEEKLQLIAARNGEVVVRPEEMVKRGLLEVQGRHHRPRGRLWARYLEQRGRVTGADADERTSVQKANQYIYRQNGQFYEVHFCGEHGGFGGKGFDVLRRLLEKPNQAVPATVLQEYSYHKHEVQDEDVTVSMTSTENRQPKTDAKTLEKVRNQINALDVEIKKLREARDDAIAEKKQGARDKLYAHLADCLHNPDGFLQGAKAKIKCFRGSEQQDAMDAVRKNLENAYKKMEKNRPPLSLLIKHLKNSIEPQAGAGGYAYCPAEPQPHWQFD